MVIPMRPAPGVVTAEGKEPEKKQEQEATTKALEGSGTGNLKATITNETESEAPTQAKKPHQVSKEGIKNNSLAAETLKSAGRMTRRPISRASRYCRPTKAEKKPNKAAENLEEERRTAKAKAWLEGRDRALNGFGEGRVMEPWTESLLKKG